MVEESRFIRLTSQNSLDYTDCRIVQFTNEFHPESIIIFQLLILPQIRQSIIHLRQLLNKNIYLFDQTVSSRTLIGYGDGWYQQFKPTSVLIDGQCVPTIGCISMDQLMVALPQKYPVGTRVTFIGRQGNETIVADDIARLASQPRSEVFTSLSNRLPRRCFHNGSIHHIRNAMLDLINLP